MLRLSGRSQPGPARVTLVDAPASVQGTRSVRSTPRMLSIPRSSAVRSGCIAALAGRN
jgi:hypothetical protein